MAVHDAICKDDLENSPLKPGMCYDFRMRMMTDRAVLTVQPHDGGWAVELEGEVFGRSPDKEVAKAAANRRARQIQDEGRPCQVRISGEHGFFGGV